jgi:hypothetical protein
VGVVMKKVRNIALLMLLFFSLSGCPGDPILDPIMRKISKHQLENIRKGFGVSVRTCDEKNYLAYWEVLNKMGYEIDRTWPWVSLSGWQIDAVGDDKDDRLRVNCGSNLREAKWMLGIYSRIPYFPKERIHQKALERLKIQAK